MNKLRQRGFTVVEVVVIVIVISILASLTIVAFIRVQADSRDQKRKTDATLFVNAMETYYERNGEYPSGCGTANAASSASCQVATGVVTGGAAMYQDSTITQMRAILPSLSSDFGGPRGDPVRPFQSSGASDGLLTRYVYWGQLNGTAVGASSAGIMGGATSTANINCGLGSSTISITVPAGALPKQTSFFIAYYGESDSKWYIYQGKRGGSLTNSGVPVRGTTVGNCIFVS